MTLIAEGEVVYLAALAAGYGITRLTRGATAAARMLPGIAVGLLGVGCAIAFGLVLLRLPPNGEDQPWIGILLLGSVLLWAWMATRALTRRQAGRLLLELGRPKGINYLLLVVALTGGNGLGFLSSALSEPTRAYMGASHSLIRLSLAALLVFCLAGRAELREHGIRWRQVFRRWDQIADYEWPRDGTLRLRVWPYWSWCAWRWQVSFGQREAVKQILAQHVRAGPPVRTKAEA